MGIDVKWSDMRHPALCLTYEAQWTAEDQLNAQEYGAQMLADVEYPVCVIFDLSGTSDIPEDFYEIMPDIAKSALFAHPQVRRVVMVGAQQLHKGLSQVMMKAYPHMEEKMVFASSMVEAEALVAEA